MASSSTRPAWMRAVAFYLALAAGIAGFAFPLLAFLLQNAVDFLFVNVVWHYCLSIVTAEEELQFEAGIWSEVKYR